MLGRALGQQGQGQRQRKEGRAQDGGGTRQQIGRAAPAHEGPHALGRTHAKPAALTPLEQDHANQREGDEKMQDEKDGNHGSGLLAEAAAPG